MSDGTIRIDISVDNKDIDVANESLDNLEKSGEKSSSSMKDLAKSLGLVAVGAAAFNELRKSVGQAVKRFDTLQKFPKVLQSLGVSAEDSERAMSTLSDGIDGLPTTLDDIASTAQRMYTSFGDMDKAADSALALNNALLGSGASADQARRGTEMYLKSLQTGEIDLQTWRSLSETMDIGLVKVAESFGYAGASAKDDLYQALKDGKVTMDDFNDRLIDLGTGTGELAQLAKENSLGIATSFANLRNAAAVGIANIIESFDNLAQEVTGKTIAEHLDRLKGVVNTAFKAIQKAIETTTPVLKLFFEVAKVTFDALKRLTPVLVGLGTAFAVHAVITKTTRALKNFQEYSALSFTAQQLLTRQLKLSTLAAQAKEAVVGKLRKAMTFLTSPIGLATAALGLLAAGTVAVIKWFNRASKEEKELTEQTNELAESTRELNDDLENSADEHRKNMSEVNNNAKANQDLADKIQDLSEKEDKSAADKALLKTYTDQLNESVEGLNLAYSEQTDSLNMTNDEMNNYIQLMKDQETLEESQSRMVDVMKERNKAEDKLEEINEQRSEWNEHLEDGGKKGKEAKEAIKELDAEEAALTETNAELSEEYNLLQDKIVETTESINNNSVAQMQQLQELLEEHEDVFNDIKEEYDSLADAATDAFERINDESKHSIDEMLENMDHNNEMTEAWGENHANLMEWASKEGYEGFMKHLDSMGIDQAAELQVMADALEDHKEGSDKTLAELAGSYDRNAETAMEAYNKRMGGGFEDALDIISSFPGSASRTLIERVEEAGFYDIGADTAEGFSEGMLSKMETISKVGMKMAEKASFGLTSFAEIRSPSRLFMRHGEDISKGTAIGIENGESNILTKIQSVFDGMMNRTKTGFKGVADDSEEGVNQVGVKMLLLSIVSKRAMDSMIKKVKAGGKSQIQYMKSLSANMYSAFASMPSQMSSIGVNAMSGLNSGLWSGKARVITTARNIANSVASTMRSALRIHSPSRVTEDIGVMTGKGLVNGINSMHNNVMRGSLRLAKASIPDIPALGLASPRVKSNDKTRENAKHIMKLFFRLTEA